MRDNSISSPGALSTVAEAGNPESGADRTRSYRKILESSTLIGGSTIITLAIGLVRNKAMALLLGPAGFGVMGMYAQIVEITRTVAQLGVQNSGVRQIADAASSGNEETIARTVHVLRRLSLLCALLGAIALAVLAEPVSQWSFGSADHSQSMNWLAAAVLFTLLAGGQGALLQGMRRIGDMARIAILGGLLGTVLGIPVVYFKGEAGIAPSMVIAAACVTGVSWWYSRKIRVRTPEMAPSQVLQESGSLLKLGLAFMASALLTMGAAFVVRLIVMKQGGLEAVGIYQAAWTIGGLYIGFILQALGTDFYPRLVGVVNDHAECNRVVNEQAHVSLLLATPGIVGTLTLAPLIISVLYSSSFVAAVDILRWICIGMVLRVMTYPLGYIIVAKNRQIIFFLADMGWALLNVLLTLWAVQVFGTTGVGMAYAASYLLHAALIYPIARRLTGFRWSPAYFGSAWKSSVAIVAVFAGFEFLPSMYAYGLGIATTMACCYISAGRLLGLVSPHGQSGPVRFLLKLCRWVR